MKSSEINNTQIFKMLKRISGLSNEQIFDDLMLWDSNQKQRMRRGNKKKTTRNAWWPEKWEIRYTSETFAQEKPVFVSTHNKLEKLFEQQVYEVFLRYIDKYGCGSSEEKEVWAKKIIHNCLIEDHVSDEDVNLIISKPLNEAIYILIERAKSASGRIIESFESTSDESKGSDEPKKSDESQRIEPVKPKTKYRLIPQLPISGSRFVDRQNEVNRIAEAFAEGNRVILLRGIDGIGKSSVIKKYILKHKSEFDCVLFVRFNESICKTVGAYQIDGMLKWPDEKPHDYFVRMMEIFRSLATDRTLLVVTNFTNADDPDMELFLRGTHKVIFSGNIEASDFYTIPIGEIKDDAELKKLFEFFYERGIKPEDESKILSLFDMVERHTFTIELLAKQMRSEFLTLDSLLNQLRMNTFGKEKVSDSMGHKDTVSNHLCSIFSMDSMTEEEYALMRVLFFSGEYGTSARRLQTACGMQDFNSLNHLIAKDWIRKKAEYENIFYLHPVVAKVVPFVIPATVENCSYFLKKLAVFVFNSRFHSISANHHIKHMVLNVLEYFQPFPSQKARIWFQLCNYLIVVGEYDKALHFHTKLYEVCVESFGKDSIEASCAAIGIGDCYYSLGEKSIAAEWYKKGLSGLLNADVSTEDLAIAYEKNAMCAQWDNSFLEIADDYLQNALQIYLHIREHIAEYEADSNAFMTPYCRDSRIDDQITLVYHEISMLYQRKMDFERALLYVEKADENLKQLSDRYLMCFPSTSALIHLDKGICYYHMGIQSVDTHGQTDADHDAIPSYWTSALEELQEARKLNFSMYGEFSSVTIDTELYLAKALCSLCRFQEAFDVYSSVLTTMKSQRVVDEARIQLIEEQIDIVSSKL